ncbi:MarR family winged helix-turn-helix transcriptional regulator [Novosphingobium sp. G106]|uniref:MarR family transcriptional regulator n=1 Tax=Novosphingobium sp. G106 TaxID=2849500 RepID=UPI001C2DEE6E|nr:helix-turn-helix domain-containing protein [Novosphingobium sp. G106]MBV1686706.1 MarR family winged helix-turn-helix transcriptional regulator [Novosphingobium sp. G106]
MSDQAYNRLSVLKALRAAEPVSRTDLAELSGLNGGTITAIVRDLVERGLVIEERVPSPTADARASIFGSIRKALSSQARP